MTNSDTSCTGSQSTLHASVESEVCSAAQSEKDEQAPRSHHFRQVLANSEPIGEENYKNFK